MAMMNRFIPMYRIECNRFALSGRTAFALARMGLAR